MRVGCGRSLSDPLAELLLEPNTKFWGRQIAGDSDEALDGLDASRLLQVDLGDAPLAVEEIDDHGGDRQVVTDARKLVSGRRVVGHAIS